MELQEVNIAEEKPLLFENPQNADTVKVECSYIAGGTTHSADLSVTIQGDKSCARAFVTLHDLGMNHVSNFSTLFNSPHMEPIAQRFCIYHIDAPGMEDGADDLSKVTGFVYPSMENLSDMLPKIFTKFGIKEAICMGCGAGANVFIRFALKNPTLVDGLIAVNPMCGVVGNISWIGEKITNFATPLHEQILNYHFSKEEVEKANQNLVNLHRDHLQNKMNINNVNLFMKEFERRTEIYLVRPLAIVPGETDKNCLSCNTLLMVGDMSPFVEDVVEVNSRLNPTKTTFLKMQDAGGMIMEEQTFKVAEAIIYYLQGMGHIPSVIMSRLARSRTVSACSSGSQENDVKRVRTLSAGGAGDCSRNDELKEVLEGPASDKARLVTEAVC